MTTIKLDASKAALLEQIDELENYARTSDEHTACRLMRDAITLELDWPQHVAHCVQAMLSRRAEQNKYGKGA